MQKLYSKCLEKENITKAIKKIFQNEGAKTAGADGITKISNISQERIIKEVKLRLRGYKATKSRKVQIPKGNGEHRELTIINLYDRIAQQAVYQVISPILEQEMSEHSYGFRKGISAKIPVCKLASVLLHSKEVYTVELDFKKCFDNIPLDKAIGCVKEMGIRDFQLLRTIKHLMWTSEEYKGVGLSQGTILGPLLANCYLTQLDRFMERKFELKAGNGHHLRDYKIHGAEWINWLTQRGKKVCCKYYRYADDTFITCHNVEEQKYIEESVKEFISQNLEIEINEAKSHKRHNEIHFLGFKLVKNGHNSIWILMDAPKEYLAKVKRLKLNTLKQCQEFMKWLRGVINYFDIANNLNEFLSAVNRKLYYRKRRGVIERIGDTFQYGEKRDKVIVDIWAMRKATRTSFKEYLTETEWIKKREYLVYKESDKAMDGSFQYLWCLWTRQRGRDAITKEQLDPFKAEIHHVKPVAKGGLNTLENLILITTENHCKLHNGKDLDRRFEKYRKHLK